MLHNIPSTSFAIGGFWYHLQPIANNVFTDQHRNTWTKKGGFFYSEFGGLKAEVPKPKQTGLISAKDMFMQQREYYHEYFHSRTALINR